MWGTHLWSAAMWGSPGLVRPFAMAPACRLYEVPAEDRFEDVAYENRFQAIPAEDRFSKPTCRTN